MTDHLNYTVNELIEMGKAARGYFENQLGYTSACFNSFDLHEHGEHRAYFSLDDDFQKDFDYDRKYKVGSMVAVDLANFWDTITTWPNREQRELKIMARKLTALDTNLDLIKSAQVKVFVARLQPDIDSIRSMITDRRT